MWITVNERGRKNTWHDLHRSSRASVADVTRKLGISEQTLYRWKERFAGLGIAELRCLQTLEEGKRKVKQLVADPSLDKKML